MEIITSAKNERVKTVKKLSDKKYRRESGLFVVEGVNIVKDLPLDADVDAFYATQSAAEELLDVFTKFSAPLYVVADGIFAAMGETVTPHGALAVVRLPHPKSRRGNVIVLDGVTDSGNLGAIIRTAAAFGFAGVYTINSADAYSGKTVRASMGGIFKVDIIETTYDGLDSLIENHEVFALDMQGDNLANITPTRPIAIIAGSEAHGVSERLLSRADHVVSIPMCGDMESLNVAVASGIAMFNYTVK